MGTTNFSIKNVIIQRANSDNTPPTPDRQIGFSGTFDSSGLTANAGNLSIKIDSGVTETKSVDFTAASVLTAVTVAEAVTAITTSAFTDITASVDATTGRLLIVYSGAGTPDFMQVFGEIASLLDFGQGVKFGGEGTKIYTQIDNTKGLTDALNLKDAEEIENESGRGDLVSVRKSPKIKGGNLVLTLIDQDNRINNVMMGGTYDETTGEFSYPTTEQDGMPKVYIEKYVERYTKGAHAEGDFDGYSRGKFYFCESIRGDVSDEAAALREEIWNMFAAQWNDTAGALQTHASVVDITVEEFDALNLLTLAG